MCFIYLLDGSYVSLEEWQRMVEKSDREVNELMEAYGNKCKKHEVGDNYYSAKLLQAKYIC